MKKAIFPGLVYDENGRLVENKLVGDDPVYVLNDGGFMRHVEAETVDRQVLAFFMSQLHANKEMAVEQALKMMGQDDLFAKAALESQVNNVNMDDILAQGIPEQARNMLGMMGFRIVINYRGELIRLDQPNIELDDE